MKTFRRLAFPIATLLAIVALLYFSPGVKGSILAPEQCVTIFENSNGQGDYWQRCGFGTGLYNASLVGDIAGLTGTPLCASTTVPFAADWNDCVSAVRVGLTTGYVAVFYRDANYGGSRICYGSHVNGLILSLAGTALNDQMSSWRILTGCP